MIVFRDFFFIKEKMGKRATWAGVFNVGMTIVAPYSPGLGLQEQRIQMSHSLLLWAWAESMQGNYYTSNGMVND